MRLHDKVAIITGAASGMGAATARIFAAEGAKVIVADVAVDDGVAVAGDITEAGGEARFVQLDVGRESDWADAVLRDVVGPWSDRRAGQTALVSAAATPIS